MMDEPHARMDEAWDRGDLTVEEKWALARAHAIEARLRRRDRDMGRTGLERRRVLEDHSRGLEMHKRLYPERYVKKRPWWKFWA